MLILTKCVTVAAIIALRDFASQMVPHPSRDRHYCRYSPLAGLPKGLTRSSSRRYSGCSPSCSSWSCSRCTCCAPFYRRNRSRGLYSTDTKETACLASISITFTMIIQMISLAIVHDWGHGWETAAYVLWWISTSMAVVSCIGIPYVFVKYEPPESTLYYR